MHEHADSGASTMVGGVSWVSPQVMVLSLSPQWNWSSEHALGLVLHSSVHGPSPHWRTTCSHACTPPHSTRQAWNGGHTMVVWLHACSPPQRTKQGPSGGHVSIRWLHTCVPRQSTRHSPFMHSSHAASQLAGGGLGDSPQMIAAPVVLSPSVVLTPVEVPSITSVVPPELLELVAASLLLDEPTVVLLDEGSPSDELGSPAEPWPNTLGLQAKRHSKAIASPRTRQA